MIKKIIELKNIGRFVNFQQMQDFTIRVKEHSNNCNIIFGFNGSGKSTISNVLSLFGDGSFSKNKPGVLHDITRDESDIPTLKSTYFFLFWIGCYKYATNKKVLGIQYTQDVGVVFMFRTSDLLNKRWFVL